MEAITSPVVSGLHNMCMSSFGDDDNSWRSTLLEKNVLCKDKPENIVLSLKCK